MDTKRIHILVVDDLPDMANSTVEMLNLWGHDATACTSGTMALGCAQLRRPTVVLLDLVMPGMDGFEFAKLFRSLPGCESIPIVAVSGYSSPIFSAKLQMAKIDHCLLKPTDPTLLNSLLKVLTQYRPVSCVLPIEQQRPPSAVGSRRWPRMSCSLSPSRTMHLPVELV